MVYNDAQKSKIEKKLEDLAQIFFPAANPAFSVIYGFPSNTEGFEMLFDGKSPDNIDKLGIIQKSLTVESKKFFVSGKERDAIRPGIHPSNIDGTMLGIQTDLPLCPILYFNPNNPVFKEVEDALDKAIVRAKEDMAHDEAQLKEWQSRQPEAQDQEAEPTHRSKGLYATYLRSEPFPLTQANHDQLETQWRLAIAKGGKDSRYIRVPSLNGHMDENEDMVIAYLSRIMNEPHYNQNARVVCSTDEREVEPPDAVFTIYIYNPITRDSMHSLLARLNATFRGSETIRNLSSNEIEEAMTRSLINHAGHDAIMEKETPKAIITLRGVPSMLADKIRENNKDYLSKGTRSIR